jgi:hypothetical protein
MHSEASGDHDQKEAYMSRTPGVWIFLFTIVSQPARAQFVPQGNKLVSNDAVVGSRLGTSVALSQDGSTAIVGGFVDGNGVAASWIFTRTNGVWSQQGPKLVGSGAVAGFPASDSQNVDVAISGDGNIAIMGANNDTSAWVFARNNGIWSQQAKLVGSSPSPGSVAHTAVALSLDGNTAVLGNSSANGGLGTTWVFTRSNGTWSIQTQLVGQGSIAIAQCPVNQGFRVAVVTDGDLDYSGGAVLVGGPGDDNCKGAAWLFTFDPDTPGWDQGQKLVGQNASGYSKQGSWVALSDGRTALISATGGANGAGAAWFFGGGTQTKVDGFGGPVALSFNADTAVIGGSVFRGGIQQQNLESGPVSISADASTVMIGTPGDNAGVGAASAFMQPTANHFSVSAPASVISGVPFNFTVTALDANNNPVSGYSGIVNISGSDLQTATSLPYSRPLSNSTGTFSATFFNRGNQFIYVNDPMSPLFRKGSSAPIAVVGGAGGTVPLGSLVGAGSAQEMAFYFNESQDVMDLLANVLISSSLDARNACYLAYSVKDNILYLVADNGVTLLPLPLNGLGSVSNSQCTITGAGTYAQIGANTLALTVYMYFNASFGGHKIIYMAARDVHGGNSGWQPLGVWRVPYNDAGTISAQSSVAPPRTIEAAGTSQPFVVTVADSKGAGDFGVVNLLVNSSLDGRQACYLAFVPASNTLFLVDDAGDAGGPFAGAMVLNGNGAPIQNGQCIVNSAQWGVLNGNTLVFTPVIAFKSSFLGNRVVWVAARDVAEGNNTGWQAAGTTTVQ